MLTRIRGVAAWMLGVLVAASLAGCAPAAPPPAGTGGPGAPPDGSTGPPPDGSQRGVLIGQVATLSGDPIPGAAVTLSTGRSASTDDHGFYSFGDLQPGSSVVATFRAVGFAPTVRAFAAVTADAATPACVLLAAAGDTVTVDAQTTSTQRSGASAVTLTAGSLASASGEPVTGSVELTTTFLDPSTAGVLAFPGAFDTARSDSGDVVTLESFGFAIYEMSQNGEPVDLAPGETADIEYVLPDNAQDKFAVGDTIPLWEFDDMSATWTEAGVGQIAAASDGSGRLAWFATVDHFSSWNCDAPIDETHCLTGRVVSDGAPVAGAAITAVGVSYNGTSTATSGLDGRFCIDVKRGSSVRLEVRLNGSATAILTVDVTVADTPADCASGGCTDTGDLSVSLDACVSGRVTNDDGTPADGVTVHVVPGETVTTDADGFYCAAASANTDVFVFVEGRPSVMVGAAPVGTCGGSACAEADLALSLPEAGDAVGTIFATSNALFTDVLGTTGSFFLQASFITFDADALRALDASAFLPSGFDTQIEQIGVCEVVTQTFAFTSGGGSDPVDPPSFPGIGALDPGAPGTATTATATVNLLRGDPTSTDPPQPVLAGIFEPDETSEELMALGFGAGQSIVLHFPGGADIGAFDATLVVPDAVNVTSPDLADANLTLDRSAPLNVMWTAGSATDTVVITITASATSFSFQPDGSATTSGESVAITCDFPDTGSAVVPAQAMAALPADPDVVTFNAARTRTSEVDVPLNRVAGNGVVRLTGSAGASRSVFGVPGGPAPSLCDLITCPQGEVCNPDTFVCEPG
ncbi:MAG: carboxypeptidase-like regulatory domain-containing protein [Phycisphaerae bacterium]